MKFLPFPFASQTTFLNLLRLFLGFLMGTHGAARIYYQSVGNFGTFLESKGFFFGFLLASGITAMDLIGGVLLMLGFWVKWISLWFILVLAMGIFLVHLSNGWFVVGHQTGGVEYSLLLIICFLVTASTKKLQNGPLKSIFSKS